jgi:hypothetical protein
VIYECHYLFLYVTLQQFKKLKGFVQLNSEGYFFLRTNKPQMKNPISTMVDTIVMASKLPLIKAGILLRMSKPKTISTAMIYVVLFIAAPLFLQ